MYEYCFKSPVSIVTSIESSFSTNIFKNMLFDNVAKDVIALRYISKGKVQKFPTHIRRMLFNKFKDAYYTNTYGL